MLFFNAFGANGVGILYTDYLKKLGGKADSKYPFNFKDLGLSKNVGMVYAYSSAPEGDGVLNPHNVTENL